MFAQLFICLIMKKDTVVPICKIEIVDPGKVKFAKKKLSNKKQITNIGNIFKLLGEPTRLKILFSLMDNELCVCDLAATIDTTISAISHQLRLLRNARLVKFRKDGKMVYYTIKDEHIKKLIEQIAEHVLER